MVNNSAVDGIRHRLEDLSNRLDEAAEQALVSAQRHEKYDRIGRIQPPSPDGEPAPKLALSDIVLSSA